MSINNEDTKISENSMCRRAGDAATHGVRQRPQELGTSPRHAVMLHPVTPAILLHHTPTTTAGKESHSLNKHALMILGSALIPAICIAITHALDAVVPVFVVSSMLLLGQMRPRTCGGGIEMISMRFRREGTVVGRNNEEGGTATQKHAQDVKHQYPHVDTADGTRGVLRGVAHLTGCHAEDFGAKPSGWG